LDRERGEKTSERLKRGVEAEKKWQLAGKCGKIVSETGGELVVSADLADWVGLRVEGLVWRE
jgi:hypothetical protein